MLMPKLLRIAPAPAPARPPSPQGPDAEPIIAGRRGWTRPPFGLRAGVLAPGPRWGPGLEVQGRHVRAPRPETGSLASRATRDGGRAEYAPLSRLKTARHPRKPRVAEHRRLTSSDCMVPAIQRAQLARSRKLPYFFRRLTSGMPSLTYRESSAVSDSHTAPPGGGARVRAFPAPARSARQRALTSRGACPGSPRAQTRLGARSSPRRRSRERPARPGPQPPGCRAPQSGQGYFAFTPSPSEWLSNSVLCNQRRSRPHFPSPRTPQTRVWCGLGSRFYKFKNIFEGLTTFFQLYILTEAGRVNTLTSSYRFSKERPF